MMGADACVVDTNVLVYSTVSGNPWHQQARQWLSAMQSAGAGLCVTTQVLREYLVILTRGAVFENSFEINQVLAQLEAFLPSFTVLDEPVEVAEILRGLVRQYQIRGKRVHDANIVAVMLAHGVHRLATYNQADFEQFDEIALEKIPAQDTGDVAQLE
jgi:predicted nucleic acid-binding protein